MTIVAGLLGRRKGAVAAAVGIGVYTLLVGANAAVVRAAIMGGLALFARQVGRRQDGLNSLALVAAVMALFDPNVLWDVGFQLSFMATLGLVLYAGPLSQAFQHLVASRWSLVAAQRISRPVSEYCLFTLAAQVTTLPVTIYHFGRLSLVSLVANPFILPAQPMVMILGGLAALLGLAWFPLGKLAAFLAWPFVVYTIRTVELFARLPGGELALGEVALPVVLLFYTLLLGWTFFRPRLQFLAPLWKPSSVLSILGVLAVLVWRAALSAPDGRLHLAVLDVGGGEALLIRTPTGRSLLVNGGSSPSRLSDALGRRLPFGQRRLDWLVVAATGSEQIAALPRSLERFPPEQVLWAGAPDGTYPAGVLRERLVEAQIPITDAQAGQALELGAGARLKVLSVCQRGAVLLLEWQNFSALLPLGLDFDTLEALQNDRRLGQVDALLLAESGYAPANPPEWIGKLRPGVALLSIDAGGRRGLPDAETMEAMEGYTLLRTDRNGWIEITTDGERMWVQVERR